MKQKMMKNVFKCLGFVLLLLSFSSCSDDNTSNGNSGLSGQENLDFAVRIPHGKSSYVIVVGGITGDVKDIFIPRAHVNSAMHRDYVEVLILPGGGRRPEGIRIGFCTGKDGESGP